MSERMTAAHLPTLPGSGWADYGRCEPSEVIASARRHARHQLDQALAVLTATDAEFEVETYVGVHSRRSREVIQEATTATGAPAGADDLEKALRAALAELERRRPAARSGERGVE